MPSNARKIIDAAKGFACGIYNAYPGDLIDNPIQDFRRMIWDELCGNNPPPGTPPLPPPPGLPFTGGQCNCARYKISFEATGGGFGSNIYRGTMDVWGPITANGMKYGLQNKSVVFYVICRGSTGACGAVGTEVKLYEWGLPSSDPVKPLGKITGVAPVGTAPNNCGDPQKDYPLAPVTPLGGYKSPPIQITMNDGDTTNIFFTLNPPARVPVATSPPPIIVNMVRPEINPEVNIPISFNFDGTVNIGSPSGTTPTLPPGVEDKINNINDNSNNTNINLNDFLKDWNFSVNPPPYATDPGVDTTPGAPPNDGEEDKEDLLGIKIHLTKFPDKAQFGNPTVFFAGWVSFKLQGGQGERMPIHFEDSYFNAPPGATGYSYTLTNGAEGEVAVFSKKAEP